MFDSPVLEVRQRSAALEYDISDAGGSLVGRAAQVTGPKPRQGFAAAAHGAGLDGAHVGLDVTGQDGTLLCRIEQSPQAVIAITAPDGAVLGVVDYDEEAMVQEMASEQGALGTVRGLLGFRKKVLCQRLLDAAGAPMCRVRWTMGRPGDRTVTPVSCDLSDMDGVLIAQISAKEGYKKDRYRLEMKYRLPDPLRTVVIAYPLAFDLSRA